MTDEQNPAERLPEAFTNEAAEDGPSIKKIYESETETRSRRTSTGMNVADEGSAESFPASDPPAPMASSSPTDAPPANTGR